MKFKTKYKIGDIVEYYRFASDTVYNYGTIIEINIRQNTFIGVKYEYKLEEFVAINNSPHTYMVKESDIHKKLNKNAFLKAYSSECAKITAKARKELGDL